MTGNKKWRKSLAGLAAVATLATMGLVAGTANAALVTDPVTVKFENAQGLTSLTGKYGYTLDDVLDTAGETLTPVASPAGYSFVGWTVDNNTQSYADFDAPLKGDETVSATYAKTADTTQVTFDNNNFADHTQNIAGGRTYLTVRSADETVPANRLPQATITGSRVTEYTVTGADGVAQKPVSAADAAANGLELTGKAPYTVTTKTEAASTVTFNASGVTGVAAVSGADGTTRLDLKVSKNSAPVNAPDVVYSASGTVYTQWTNGKTDLKIGDPIPADIDTTLPFTLDERSAVTSTLRTVTFDLNGGNGKIDPVQVKDGESVAKPADPTRDGWVFQGWKSGDANLDTADGFYAFESKVKSDLTLTAQWAKVADIKVTFSAGNYNGAGDDTTVTVAGDAFVDESKAPKFTREGYTYDNWALDLNGDGNPDTNNAFDFDTTLAGSVNKGKSFTLVPLWERVDENDAKNALNYVSTGISKVSEVRASSDARYFTDASWKAFETVYKAEYQKYASAKYKDGAAGTNEVDSKTSAEIVNALKDAWKDLRFSAKYADTVLDAKDNSKEANTAKVVYRLNRLAGLHHLLTADENEVLDLTNKYVSQGGWTKDETTFRVVNVETKEEQKASPLYKPEWVSGKLGNSTFSPLLTEVVRLYNSQLQEHMYTSDQNEIDTLTAGDWTEDSNLASFYVPALYNGSTKVTRLYNPSTHLHLYTADSHEVSVLTTKGGWTKDSDNASFYAL